MTTKKPKAAVHGKIHLKWVRSAICAPVKQKLVVKGLGLILLMNQVSRAAFRWRVYSTPAPLIGLDAINPPPPRP